MSAERTSRRAGFTLLELLVAGTLSVGLTLITAQFWGYYAGQLKDLNARARVAQELRFAMKSIAGDMGATVGAVPLAADRVLLCKDGGDAPNGAADWGEPDSLVLYSLVNDQLVREDQSVGLETVVADCVSAFTVENVTESTMRIEITVRRDDMARHMTLLWSRP